MAALEGVRILELASGVAAAFAGRLLAEHGAEVVKAEPPEGDAARYEDIAGSEPPAAEASSLFLFLNQGKQSVVADVGAPPGREWLRDAAPGFDVILTDLEPATLAAAGLDWPTLHARLPHLGVIDVSPFGRTGAYAGYRATSLVAFAMGGQMAVTGDPGGPPRKTFGRQAEYQAGLHTFAAAALCVFDRKRGNPGQRVEIAAIEAQASAVQHQGPLAYAHGIAVPRLGNVTAPTWGIFECDGGHLGVFALPGNYAVTAKALVVPPDEAARLFEVDGDIMTRPDELEATVRAWCYGVTSEEAHRIGGETGAPICAILTVPELLEWPPLVEKRFWQQVDHPIAGPATYPGPAITIGGVRPAGRRAPLLGEHSDRRAGGHASDRSGPPTGAGRSTRAPLEGIRVLDHSLVWSGPYAGALLAEMGAEVIKVEGAATFDIARILSPVTPLERANRYSPYFQQHNRGKYGVSLDLKDPAGREAFLQLVATSDVMLDNYRAGVFERLGLDYATLHATNPRLVRVSMPGFSMAGAERDRAAYGPVVEAMSGLASLGGVEGGPPLGSGVSYGDPVSGTLAAGAVILGLLERERRGEGVQVEVSQRDNMLSLIGEVFVEYSRTGRLPPRTDNRHGRWAPQGVYRCRDAPSEQAAPLFGGGGVLSDRWLAISVTDDREWRALCGVMGREDLSRDRDLRGAAGRRARHDEVDAALEAWAHGRDFREAAATLQAAGVPAGPVLHPIDLARDPHLVERAFFETIEHPVMGRSVVTAPVWRLSETPMHHQRAAPLVGEHHGRLLGGGSRRGASG